MMGMYDTCGGGALHDKSADYCPSDEECDAMNRQDIYAAIEKERAHQVDRWGNGADDTKNEPNDWVAYIAHHSTRWFNGGFAPYDAATVNKFREQMIKVATLAVAAIESLDRQRDDNLHGLAFFEKNEDGCVGGDYDHYGKPDFTS